MLPRSCPSPVSASAYEGTGPRPRGSTSQFGDEIRHYVSGAAIVSQKCLNIWAMMKNTRTFTRSMTIAAGAAALTLGLAACGGSDNADGGGGSATCDQATFENLAKESAGASFASFNEFQCEDGYALVSFSTDDNGVQGTEVLLFQAEGQFWALQQRDAVCADGGGAGVPSNFRDTLCALR